MHGIFLLYVVLIHMAGTYLVKYKWGFSIPGTYPITGWIYL